MECVMARLYQEPEKLKRTGGGPLVMSALICPPRGGQNAMDLFENSSIFETRGRTCLFATEGKRFATH